MAQEIPGFERDPELDDLLTSDLNELDEGTLQEVQRYKSRLLKARRDAEVELARPPWWGDSPAPETMSELDFSGVDLEAVQTAEPEQTTEEQPDAESASEPEETEPESAESEPDQSESEPSEEPETEDQPAEIEISDDDLEEVGFELDSELEQLLDEDISSIESEERRQEVQLYRSRKVQARQKLRDQRTGGEADSGDSGGEAGGEAGPEGDGRKAPPPEDVSQYDGDRKIADLVSERTSGREITRRGFFSKMALGWAGLASMFTLTSAAAGRFFFPNVLANPPEQFTAGRVEDYPPGTVSERFISDYRVWIVNLNTRLVAILAVCTHLGCTPSWLSSQRIFKCPCHGSGYYRNGVNFEGPAPRPMDRVAIRLSPGGTIIVNKARTFARGASPSWDHEDAYIPV